MAIRFLGFLSMTLPLQSRGSSTLRVADQRHYGLLINYGLGHLLRTTVRSIEQAEHTTI